MKVARNCMQIRQPSLCPLVVSAFFSDVVQIRSYMWVLIHGKDYHSIVTRSELETFGEQVLTL
jgi:hypothetical protein